MFTIKYIYPTGQESITGPYELVSAEWVTSDGSHVDPRWVDGIPHIAGKPIEQPIYRVVYGYKVITPEMENIKPGASGSATMTYGPNIPAQPTPEAVAEYEKQCNLAGQGRAEMPPPLHTPTAYPRGRVFVMNDNGATVAKYEL